MKKKLTYILVAICGQIAMGQGRIGIGTQNPTADLHIKSNKEYIFSLRDGVHQEDSYVLAASGIRGVIKKKSTNIFKTLKFARLNESAEIKNLIIDPADTYIPKYVGKWNGVRDATLELPYGKWAVYITSIITLDNMSRVPEFRNTAITTDVMIVDYDDWAAKIYDKPSAYVEGDTKDSLNGNGFVSGALVFPNQKETIKGIIIINNTDTTRSVRTFRFSTRMTVNTENEYTFNILKEKTVVGILSTSNPQTQVYAVPLN